MSDLLRLEVRCCCNPDRRLGWLWIQPRDCYHGAELHYRAAMQVHWNPLLYGDEPDLRIVNAVATIHLEVSWLHIGRNEMLAVKSNDTPIGVLRAIPTFLEDTARGEQQHGKEETEGGTAGPIRETRRTGPPIESREERDRFRHTLEGLLRAHAIIGPAPEHDARGGPAESTAPRHGAGAQRAAR